MAGPRKIFGVKKLFSELTEGEKFITSTRMPYVRVDFGRFNARNLKVYYADGSSRYEEDGCGIRISDKTSVETFTWITDEEAVP